MKYPIGIQTFEQIIEDGYVYVDKTELVYRLVSEGKIYFLSRPRRFGKSLLLSTLKSYYQGKKELFKGLAIEKLEKEWKKYPIFHIDFNGGNFKEPGELKKKITGYIANWEKKYGADEQWTTLGDRFSSILCKAHEQTGLRAVVLVDEYDKPLLDVLDTSPELEEEHRNILKGFFSTFKAADRKRTILAPFFTPFISPLIPSLMKLAGYKAENLPMSDAVSCDCGLQYANNEVCYPATLIVGDIVKAFKHGRYDPKQTAVAMVQTGGQCRASNYLSLIKRALTESGFGDVPVISLTFGSNLKNNQPGFRMNWLKMLPAVLNTLLYSDCIAKLYYAAAAREKEKGSAIRLKDMYLNVGISDPSESAEPSNLILPPASRAESNVIFLPSVPPHVRLSAVVRIVVTSPGTYTV